MVLMIKKNGIYDQLIKKRRLRVAATTFVSMIHHQWKEMYMA
jgi:hypothetical protein